MREKNILSFYWEVLHSDLEYGIAVEKSGELGTIMQSATFHLLGHNYSHDFHTQNTLILIISIPQIS